MSKHFSDRYVNPQSSHINRNLNDGANNGRLVEVLVCVLLGAIVSFVLWVMVLGQVKPLTAAVEEINQEQSAQLDEYDCILNGIDVLPE